MMSLRILIRVVYEGGPLGTTDLKDFLLDISTMTFYLIHLLKLFPKSLGDQNPRYVCYNILCQTQPYGTSRF